MVPPDIIDHSDGQPLERKSFLWLCEAIDDAIARADEDAKDRQMWRLLIAEYRQELKSRIEGR